MKYLLKFKCVIATIVAMIVVGCAVEPLTDTNAVTEENPDYAIIRSLGLNTDDIIETEDSYVVEGDIAFDKKSMQDYLGKTRQRYFSCVALSKVNDIKVYVNPELQTNNVNNVGVGTWYNAALDAIAEWNSIPDCMINFSTVASATSADVVVIRNSEADSRNYIAYAYYPSLSGNPGRSVNVSFKNDHLSAGRKKRTMTHEFGHILGFVHPNEAIGTHIPGTPNGEYESIMHISDGRAWSGFTAADIIAAQALYGSAWDVEITGLGSPWASLRVNYSIPTSLPSGMVFNNWTITPSLYTVTGGLNDPYLRVTFNYSGQYRLKANFTLLGSIPYSVTKTIDVAPPPPPTPIIYGRGATEIYLPGYTDHVFWARPGTSVEFIVANLSDYAPQVTFDWLVPPFNSGISTHTGKSYTATIPASYGGSGIHGGIHGGIWCKAIHGGTESDICTTYLYISSNDPTYRSAAADSLVKKLKALPKPSKEEFDRLWKLHKQ